MSSEGPSSWADMIKGIEKEKRSLSWDPKTVEPTIRKSTFENKRAQREYDPITLSYRDPARDAASKAKRAEALEFKKTTVLEQTRNSFNILNHQGPPRKIDQMKTTASMQRRPSRRHEILSNMAIEDHPHAPTLYDAQFANTSIKKLNVRSSAPTLGKTSYFNVISNEITAANAAEMRQAEYDHVKDRVLKKYWETHDYNMVTGQYYDGAKQEKYEAQRKLISTVHGTGSIAKLPPSYKYSDGNSYNILTHDVFDEKQFMATNTVANKSLNKIKRTEIEKRWSEEGICKGEIEEKRRENRASYSRFKNEIDRGYDPIKNRLFGDHEPQPFPARPPTNWARLTSGNGVRGSNTGVFGETGDGTSGEGDYHGEFLQPPRSTRDLSGGYHSNTGVSSSRAKNNSQRLVKSATPNQAMSSPVGLEVAESFLASTTSKNYRENTARSTNQQQNNLGRESETAITRPVTTAVSTRYNNYSNSSRNNNDNNNNTNKPTSSQTKLTVSRSIPSLDIVRAEYGEAVTYVEPKHGSKGMAVPIIRTGGLSGM